MGIGYTVTNVRCDILHPIQKQIYLDKAFSNVIDIMFNKIGYSTLICDYSYNLLDGNHRWLAYMLINPEKYVEILRINRDYQSLIPMLSKYSKVILKERNRK